MVVLTHIIIVTSLLILRATILNTMEWLQQQVELGTTLISELFTNKLLRIESPSKF